MLRIPAIAPAIIIRKRRLVPFQRDIRAAHDGLPHVVEAVDHVPVVVVRDGVVGFQTGVGLGDCELCSTEDMSATSSPFQFWEITPSSREG